MSDHVMAALVAAIHNRRAEWCSWIAGTSPAMTKIKVVKERA
jgi:hypothetical protein